MKIGIASTSLLALPSLNLLIEKGYTVSTLFTKKGKPKGRGKEVSDNEISEMAKDVGLSIVAAEDDSQIAETIHRDQLDLVIAISFGKILKKEALIAPTYGWLNLHFSKLPQFRGAAPVQRAILAGQTKSGLTVFKLNEGMDTGPIYRQCDFDLKDLNATEALKEMSHLGSTLVLEAIAMIESGKEPMPQVGLISEAKKIEKNDLRIVWNGENNQALRQIRAFADSPGAWTEFRGKKIKILKAEAGSTSGIAGEILNLEPFTVGTGEGSVVILDVQPESSRRMLVVDWLRGARVAKGESFR